MYIKCYLAVYLLSHYIQIFVFHVCTGTTFSSCICINDSMTGRWHVQSYIINIISWVAEHERCQLKDTWRLNEKEATNAPDVSDSLE